MLYTWFVLSVPGGTAVVSPGGRSVNEMAPPEIGLVCAFTNEIVATLLLLHPRLKPPGVLVIWKVGELFAEFSTVKFLVEKQPIELLKSTYVNIPTLGGKTIFTWFDAWNVVPAGE